ncbi:hypothetical protein RI367_008790, partial [Sorochytrium milnesiophthora]
MVRLKINHATTDIHSDNGQHEPEYATLERLWQQLYHQGSITASWQDLPPQVRRQKFDLTSGRFKYCHQTGHAIKQWPVAMNDMFS